MTTLSAKKGHIAQNWYIIDASGKTLGRLATAIAHRLRGKHKPYYTAHVDTGDYIIVINTSQLRVTGNKAQDKNYHWHTGYPGGIKSTTFNKLLAKNPCRVLQTAIDGMMPNTPLGRQMLRKLHLYAHAEHKHIAQQPEPLEV